MAPASDAEDRLAAVHHLAHALWSQGSPEEAERFFREALELRIKLYGEDHRETVSEKRSLALILQELGQYDEARKLLQEVVALRRVMLGTQHVHTLRSLEDLAA